MRRSGPAAWSWQAGGPEELCWDEPTRSSVMGKAAKHLISSMKDWRTAQWQVYSCKNYFWNAHYLHLHSSSTQIRHFCLGKMEEGVIFFNTASPGSWRGAAVIGCHAQPPRWHQTACERWRRRVPGVPVAEQGQSDREKTLTPCTVDLSNMHEQLHFALLIWDMKLDGLLYLAFSINVNSEQCCSHYGGTLTMKLNGQLMRKHEEKRKFECVTNVEINKNHQWSFKKVNQLLLKSWTAE